MILVQLQVKSLWITFIKLSTVFSFRRLANSKKYLDFFIWFSKWSPFSLAHIVVLTQVTICGKSAEIPRNLSWESVEIPRNLSQENPVKMSTAIPRNSRNQVQAVSCNPFRGISHNSVLGISCNQFQGFLVTNSTENPEKMSTKFVEILGNFQRKILQNQILGISWELFPRFSEEFLRNILKYSQHIPEQIH